jgi:hypothetical protein
MRAPESDRGHTPAHLSSPADSRPDFGGSSSAQRHPIPFLRSETAVALLSIGPYHRRRRQKPPMSGRPDNRTTAASRPLACPGIGSLRGRDTPPKCRSRTTLSPRRSCIPGGISSRRGRRGRFAAPPAGGSGGNSRQIVLLEDDPMRALRYSAVRMPARP